MKRFAYILIYLVLLFYVNQTKSQIFQFSQYYSSPMQLAPSYAGLTTGSRIVVNYRDQWPNIKGSFVTYSLSYDQFFSKMNSGLGMLVVKDQAGKGKLSLTDIGLAYSWDGLLNKQHERHFRPGIVFKYSQRAIDFNKLIFGDQLGLDGTIKPQSIELPPMPKKGYLDIAASALLYTPKGWLGLTLDHLLRPDQSLYDWAESAVVQLKIVTFGGIKIPLSKQTRRRQYEKDPESVTFSFHYRVQEDYDQLDIGAYYSKTPFTIGVWTRGIPVLKGKNMYGGNLDAVILLVGYKMGQMSIGYSFDFTVSNLLNATGGAHEVSIIYEFEASKKKMTKHAIISCPKF